MQGGFQMLFDKEGFALLVKKAMGSRNANQFSRELGISPSTITRILRCENKNPSSRQLLRNIADISDGKVLYTELTNVCGFANDEGNCFYDCEGAAIETIKSTLSDKEIKYKEYPYFILDGKGLDGWVTDFTITTVDIKVWVFEIETGFINESNSRKWQYDDTILAKVIALYAMDTEMERFTIVCRDIILYKKLVERLKKMNFYGYVSVLLLNTDLKNIIKEYVSNGINVFVKN